jgi:hypothetical protein
MHSHLARMPMRRTTLSRSYHPQLDNTRSAHWRGVWTAPDIQYPESTPRTTRLGLPTTWNPISRIWVSWVPSCKVRVPAHGVWARPTLGGVFVRHSGWALGGVFARPSGWSHTSLFMRLALPLSADAMRSSLDGAFSSSGSVLRHRHTYHAHRRAFIHTARAAHIRLSSTHSPLVDRRMELSA